MDIRKILETGDVAALQQLLSRAPEAANTPVRWGENGEILSHPLHFVCDKVFDGTVSGERAASLARALIEAGADLDHQNGDPLNAAASLGATDVGLVLLEAGARTESRGLFGETALHWAAITGNVPLVQRLLQRGAPVDIRDDKWKATPVGWALHGWDEPPPASVDGRHGEVIALLVRAGAMVEPGWLSEAEAQSRSDVAAALRGEVRWRARLPR